MALRPAVFLDKDGTLVENVPYNVDPSQLRFTRGALPALRALADAGFALVVVTNQPGLALGRFRRAEFQVLEDALRTRIREEGGVTLTDFMVCPHAPATPTNSCLCRKPAPGMLRQAAVAHRLDLAASWMVGDILDDVEAGRRAGARSLLLDVGNETVWRMSPLRTPERRCADLLEAASHILRHRGSADDGGAEASAQRR
ncbi:MAG TPA: HAD-IIIA family hydrolase [Methylibium sp.]|uniref:D-glycero-alpha-D-manno-heptose-1,7-bisphosphate 7-phosphatase n=1 Tax=Methylibium sp. TaxID=2067992 RepID=UPI002DBD69FB|nr:HAD-IIIA family hydrolase [Methylibium sp.]HEU4459118.1 HAD-IIIA family hydrolase [Methylibium sp.]